MATSLYIHIPFCRRKCLYCDFYSVIYDSTSSSKYVEVIIDQIMGIEQNFSTIYVGGGTPTVLEPKLLGRLLLVLRSKLRDSGEFTVEVNPESLDNYRVKLLLNCGVNRLSIGVQSLNEKKLIRLGRLHNAKKARESVLLASRTGFSNVSIDLIFGVWLEQPDKWKIELEEAVRLPVKHISCYALTYEKDAPLYDALRNKSIDPLEGDQVSAMYEAAMDLLAVHGFKQYEISNFAREGYRCIHNINYWENNSYIGLGASAVSYMNGVRSKNISSIEDYIRRYREGIDVVESSERLSPVKRARETAAVKIRTRDGIDFKWFKEKTGYDFLSLERKAVDELIEKDLVRYNRENSTITGISLKRRGVLLCDMVSRALL